MFKIARLIAGCALLLAWGTGCSSYAYKSNAEIGRDLLRHIPAGSSSATAMAYLHRTTHARPLYIKNAMMVPVTSQPHKVNEHLKEHFFHGLIICTIATYQGFDIFNTEVLAWLEFDAEDRLIDVEVSKHENAF